MNASWARRAKPFPAAQKVNTDDQASQTGGRQRGLKFEGRTSDDPEVVAWLAEQRAPKGGKIRVSQGGAGAGVMFSEEADLASWKARADQGARGKKFASL